jgi:tripeptide aminopeptidase
MAASLSPSPQRLTELFVELVRLASPSRHERAVADFVIEHLSDLGLDVREDQTAARVGGEAGNLWCVVPGRGGEPAEAPAIALGAHMDTVQPTDAIEPVLVDGVFSNSLPTILGADDKAAIAALLHATELLLHSGQDFPTFELFFTVCEEIGLAGVKHMPLEVLKSPFAAVVDSSGPVGGITTKAPSQDVLEAVFHGRAAHAGLEPERGRSAIVAASKAIAHMELGRLDSETTANIGVVSGGVATNIVPERCEVKGECRSHDEQKLARAAAAMVDAFQLGAAEVGVDVDVHLMHEYRAFALNAKAPIVQLSKAAAAAVGLQPQLLTGGGGSDANILNSRGVPTVNLDAGMTKVHSSDEQIALDDIVKICGLLLEMVRLAPDYARAQP